MRPTLWMRCRATGLAACAGLSLLMASLGAAATLGAQQIPQLSGIVLDEESAAPIEGVEVALVGFTSQVTDSLGRFAFTDIPLGRHLLRLRHLGYGTHEENVDVGSAGRQLAVRISQTAIKLRPLLVEVEAEAERRRSLGYQLNRITRDDLAPFEGTTMDLGDILAYQVPGIRVRRSTVLMGLPYCIEFRGATGGSFLRGQGTTDPGCNSPEVYLDGVLVSNPSSLYPSLPVETLESIEVVPPSEAGSRFGTGALWGAIIIESRVPGRRWSEAGEETEGGEAPRFDWAIESQPHAGKNVFLSALAANAAGVGLGLAVSNTCIRLRDPGFDSVVSDCSGGATMAAAVAGVAIPALGAALAARWTGDTPLSRGRFTAAAIGASVALVPGYAFLISSRRDGSDAAEVMGAAMLFLGTPFAVSVADRLFRSLR